VLNPSQVPLINTGLQAGDFEASQAEAVSNGFVAVWKIEKVETADR
jgi:hypothetical protein